MSNQSENINELAKSLALAQGEMQAAVKDCVNPFYKSKYADLGSVWDAARPVLSKNGLCVMQTTEIVNGEIIMVTTLAHTSGQWVKSFLPLNPAKKDSQGIGAAISYFRRYSLSALVGVVCDDEDDGETAVGRGKQSNMEPKQAPKATDIEKIDSGEVAQLAEITNQLTNENMNAFIKWLKEKYECSLNTLPKNAFQTCFTVLNAKLKQQNERVA